jgi:hypothetical protein
VGASDQTEKEKKDEKNDDAVQRGSGRGSEIEIV